MQPGTDRQNLLRETRKVRRAFLWRQKMKITGYKHIYGPVASRRLGLSLGVDLVPLKTCTYNCVYCQLGWTANQTLKRGQYVAIQEILAELERKLATGSLPDYITLAGGGEPTLNSGIGCLINKIKNMTDIPLAILTNGSLLWMREVQDEFMRADLVLPSLDVGNESLFQYVNRPHADIGFDLMVNGLAEFTERFPGAVWLEVLLLTGVTGIPSEVGKIAALTEKIKPERVQLNTVSRPAVENFAYAVDKDHLVDLSRLFTGTVEVINDSDFYSPIMSANETTDAEILALLSRRPCTVDDICAGLGLIPHDAIKRLEALAKQKAVSIICKEKRIFYQATGVR
jgi:wyosine [tRNA(Phe)-imidazoG37] synthetase (radical SAM superfamily)